MRVAAHQALGPHDRADECTASARRTAARLTAASAIERSVTDGDSFDAWGWRFMFFAGILNSVFGVFIFGALKESPIWKEMDRAKLKPQAPLKTLLSAQHAAAQNTPAKRPRQRSGRKGRSRRGS